jgi:hypothetical protein
VLRCIVLCCTVFALQVYDLLNALEDRLGVNNSAVVLATIKVRGHSSGASPSST